MVDHQGSIQKKLKCITSKTDLSTKLARSQEKSQSPKDHGLSEAHLLDAEQFRLGWWAIVLVQFPGIGLFPKLEKGFHLLPHEISAALFAQIDLILIDDHDPHTFPFLPTRFADLGFDLSFKFPHEEWICDRFSRLSARDALNVCHGIKILPNTV
jgi:hypothetical protein